MHSQRAWWMVWGRPVVLWYFFHHTWDLRFPPCGNCLQLQLPHTPATNQHSSVCSTTSKSQCTYLFGLSAVRVAECTKWAIEHGAHKKRLCSLVHRCTSINKPVGLLHGEEESVSYCFEWQLLLRIIVFYVNFEFPFVRLERTPLGETAYARYN